MQGDTSTKLFACRESVFTKLNWDTKAININEEHLNPIRIGDNIIFVLETPEQLQKILTDLNR